MTTDDRNHGHPDWSPDGNSLIFGGLPFTENDNTSAIYILDLRTHGVSTMPGSEGLWNPMWSPDGHYVAAQTNDAQKLVGFDFKTRKWDDWAKMDIDYLNWSRDGKHFYFKGTVGGEPAFYRLRVTDHKLERLASLKDVGRLAGTFAPWTGLGPDDSPLALRDIGTQEIYALDWEAP